MSTVQINSITEFKPLLNGEVLGTVERTAQGIAQTRFAVTEEKYRVPYIVFGSSFMTDIMSKQELTAIIDPTSRIETLESGKIGDAFGMGLWTDAYTHEDQHFLAADSIYFVRQEGNELKAFHYKLA